MKFGTCEAHGTVKLWSIEKGNLYLDMKREIGFEVEKAEVIRDEELKEIGIVFIPKDNGGKTGNMLFERVREDSVLLDFRRWIPKQP